MGIVNLTASPLQQFDFGRSFQQGFATASQAAAQKRELALKEEAQNALTKHQAAQLAETVRSNKSRESNTRDNIQIQRDQHEAGLVDLPTSYWQTGAGTEAGPTSEVRGGSAINRVATLGTSAPTQQRRVSASALAALTAQREQKLTQQARMREEGRRVSVEVNGQDLDVAPETAAEISAGRERNATNLEVARLNASSSSANREHGTESERRIAGLLDSYKTFSVKELVKKAQEWGSMKTVELLDASTGTRRPPNASEIAEFETMVMGISRMVDERHGFHVEIPPPPPRKKEEGSDSLR